MSIGREQQSAALSDYSGIACLLDVTTNNIRNTSDEEEDQDDAPSKNDEVETQKTQPCGVRLRSKTDAGERSEDKEDAAHVADERWKTHREKITKKEKGRNI